MRAALNLALLRVALGADVTICGPVQMGPGFPSATYDIMGPNVLLSGRSVLLVRCTDTTPTGTMKQSFTLVNPDRVSLNIVSASDGNCDIGNITSVSSQTSLDDGAFGVTVSTTGSSFTTLQERSSRVCLRVMCMAGNGDCGSRCYLTSYRGCVYAWRAAHKLVSRSAPPLPPPLPSPT
jgi:hypothetical protein